MDGYFVEGGSKWQFSLEIWSQITGENYFRNMMASLFYFYTNIGQHIRENLTLAAVNFWYLHFKALYGLDPEKGGSQCG